MNKPPKIIFILAHPDDESFIPSGSIAKYSQEGANIIYICATKGEGGHGSPKYYPPDELKMIRVKELEDACKILGINQLYTLDYPDGHLVEITSTGPIHRLITYLRRERPEIVVTFDPTGISNHTDHVTIHNWVTHAFDLCNNPFYKTEGGEPFTPKKLYYITVPSHHLVSISDSRDRERYIDGKITTIVNVEDYLDIKRQAIECHQSQCQNIHHIFKFAGGIDDLDDHEYYILAKCNIPDYAYEVYENDLLNGVVKKAELLSVK